MPRMSKNKTKINKRFAGLLAGTLNPSRRGKTTESSVERRSQVSERLSSHEDENASRYSEGILSY